MPTAACLDADGQLSITFLGKSFAVDGKKVYLCVMFSIIEHIEYLTTHHDCVTIPGWGAFIANYGTACYNGDHSIMERPQRTIGFNPCVSHNDGLLAQSLVRREGIAYDEAMSFIADCVTSFNQQLAQGSEVPMGRLGHFRYNQDRHIEFIPSSRENGIDRFYGLQDIEVKMVDVLEREIAEHEADAPTVAIPKERNLFSRKATQIAASIAVLIGLGVVLTTPVIVNRNHDMASMAPKVTAPQTQELDIDVQQGVVPGAIKRVDANSAIAATGNTAGKYYMVIATLRNQQELDAFKGKYAALVPYMKLLDYKGMMCVYVARSDDYSQLMGLRDELPEQLRDVWIYN